MGAAASLVSEDQRASMYIAVLEALPSNVYSLEERRFQAGSFYETTEFSPHRKHCCPVFAALGLHEWSVSQIWRHFRRVRRARKTCFDCYFCVWYFLYISLYRQRQAVQKRAAEGTFSFVILRSVVGRCPVYQVTCAMKSGGSSLCEKKRGCSEIRVICNTYSGMIFECTVAL